MKNQKVYIAFITFFVSLTSHFVVSQEFTYADLSKENADSIRIQAYTHFANKHLRSNPDSCFYYLQKGLEICKTPVEEGDPNKKNKDLHFRCAQHYTALGYYYYGREQSNESLKAFRKAESIFHQLNKLQDEAACLNNTAVILTKMGNNAEAIVDYYKALESYLKIGDSATAALTLNNLSRNYRDQGDIDEAIRMVEEALEMSAAVDAKEAEALALNSYAGLKKTIGDTAQALKLYEKALSLRKSLKDHYGTAAVLNNMGTLYKNQRKFEKALDYYKEAQEIAEQTDNLSGVGHTLNNQGEIYLELSDLSRAENKGLKALEIAKQTDNATLKERSSQLLMHVYERQKNWKKAFEMQSLNKKINSKILNQETQQVAQREAIRYAFEKERVIEKKEAEQFKKLQKAQSERQQVLYFSLGVVALLLIILLFFVIQRLRSTKEQNRFITKQSNERKLLLQEIHHRVKNNFQIVSSLLRLQSYSLDSEDLRESFEEAVSRINSMAIVHDIIYRQEAFSEINSKEYLEKLVYNLKRSSGNPRITFEVEAESPKLKIETLIHLGIALNELVINSFKYAFKEEQPDPKIRIYMNKIGVNSFQLIYQDNGIGINKEINESSFGMELIQTLIEHLDGSVSIESKDPWNTSITLLFKDV